MRVRVRVCMCVRFLFRDTTCDEPVTLQPPIRDQLSGPTAAAKRIGHQRRGHCIQSHNIPGGQRKRLRRRGLFDVYDDEAAPTSSETSGAGGGIDPADSV